MDEFVIDHLGKQGDGVVFVDGRATYVPFTLPGEHVVVSGKGPRKELDSIVKPSPARVEPSCRHFGSCGGCQVQHLGHSHYGEWKQELVRSALAKAGLDERVEPLVSFSESTRRKCTFSVRKTNHGLSLGFVERFSDTIIPLDACPLLLPEIADRLPDIRKLCESLPTTKNSFRLTVLASENGLDLGLEGTARLKTTIKDVLARKALALGFARFSCDGEILIEKQKPVLKMGQCNVIPPPSAFVQAIETAEQTMTRLVCAHLYDCKNVADLFCGIGTFALRLAENSTVWAVEENDNALIALDRAWRETGGRLKQVKTEGRNLDRRPVGFQELKKIDGLVFDPPRAGAEKQANQIAKSKVEKIAAVSCNPITLARDLRILTDGGNEISQIIPIDQFRYTPHVEVVALLNKR
ncbi:MAG: RNA methyltransferase [Pseudomonadota bacterium]